jgi:type VI secretion system protein ImpB
MAKKESIQHKLDRVRAPRVQITYDVEIGGAIENKELPFVVGVLADLSGKPAEPLPKLKDRKFVEIDRDNFNQVLEGMKPRLAFRVDNKLGGKEDSQIGVELKFKSMDDFHPEQVAQQVEPLRKLIEARRKPRNSATSSTGTTSSTSCCRTSSQHRNPDHAWQGSRRG